VYGVLRARPWTEGLLSPRVQFLSLTANWPPQFTKRNDCFSPKNLENQTQSELRFEVFVLHPRDKHQLAAGKTLETSMSGMNGAISLDLVQTCAPQHQLCWIVQTSYLVQTFSS